MFRTTDICPWEGAWGDDKVCDAVAMLKVLKDEKEWHIVEIWPADVSFIMIYAKFIKIVVHYHNSKSMGCTIILVYISKHKFKPN